MIAVVNVKHSRADVYVGRRCGEFEGSILGNPYKIGVDGNREQVIAKYRKWLWAEMQREGAVKWELRRIADRSRRGVVRLGCWCAPQACHAQVIKSAIEWMEKEAK